MSGLLGNLLGNLPANLPNLDLLPINGNNGNNGQQTGADTDTAQEQNTPAQGTNPAAADEDDTADSAQDAAAEDDNTPAQDTPVANNPGGILIPAPVAEPKTDASPTPVATL